MTNENVCEIVCQHCRHWVSTSVHQPGWAICVYLTGTRGTLAARLEAPDGVPIATHADFGCRCWERKEAKDDQ